VHHIKYFSRGGETSIFNALGLYWFHHKQVHLGNITISGDPNAEITFTLGDGRIYSSWPATGPP
jgi:hypothetical protein